jgi:hypothetical protein
VRIARSESTGRFAAAPALYIAALSIREHGENVWAVAVELLARQAAFLLVSGSGQA